MKIVFDDISKVYVTDCTIEEVEENFPREDFPYMQQTEEGFLLYRGDDNE